MPMTNKRSQEALIRWSGSTFDAGRTSPPHLKIRLARFCLFLGFLFFSGPVTQAFASPAPGGETLAHEGLPMSSKSQLPTLLYCLSDWTGTSRSLPIRHSFWDLRVLINKWLGSENGGYRAYFSLEGGGAQCDAIFELGFLFEKTQLTVFAIDGSVNTLPILSGEQLTMTQLLELTGLVPHVFDEAF